MKLYIYMMPNCKTCQSRSDYHELLSRTLLDMGIESVAVEVGEIDGKMYLPFEQHDSLCRKKDNPMAYSTPSYIIDVDDAAAKLADPSMYSDSNAYAQYILDTVKQMQ